MTKVAVINADSLNVRNLFLLSGSLSQIDHSEGILSCWAYGRQHLASTHNCVV